PPIFESRARFSPDNRFVVYQSSESGRNEIYVQTFPPSGRKWQVSTAGGTVATWRGDGKEMIYQSRDESFYAGPVRDSGSSVEFGLPTKLFQRHLASGSAERNMWAATRDGQRFLLITPLDDNSARTMQVVLNWAASLGTQ